MKPNALILTWSFPQDSQRIKEEEVTFLMSPPKH